MLGTPTACWWREPVLSLFLRAQVADCCSSPSGALQRHTHWFVNLRRDSNARKQGVPQGEHSAGGRRPLALRSGDHTLLSTLSYVESVLKCGVGDGHGGLSGQGGVRVRRARSARRRRNFLGAAEGGFCLVTVDIACLCVGGPYTLPDIPTTLSLQPDRTCATHESYRAKCSSRRQARARTAASVACATSHFFGFAFGGWAAGGGGWAGGSGGSGGR